MGARASSRNELSDGSWLVLPATPDYLFADLDNALGLEAAP